MGYLIKNIAIAFLISFPFLQMQAQNDIKFFVDNDWHRVDSSKAAFYSIYKQSPDTLSPSGTIEIYFINGTLLKKEDYWYNEEHKQRYRTTYFYENGSIESTINSISLQFDGDQIAFHPNGKLKWKAFYVMSELKEGKCYTAEGNDTIYYIPSGRHPSFPGGENAMQKFILDNLRYPRKAQKAGISGTVELGIIIDKLGSIQKISIIKSVDPLLDNEAVRIIQQMPKWTPGNEKDRLLQMYKVIQVKFELK